MESHALFGTYSKRCDIMHQVLRSSVSDEDTLRESYRNDFASFGNYQLIDMKSAKTHLLVRSVSIFADPLNSTSFVEAYFSLV